MTYSFSPNTNFFTVLRQPTGLAILASVGIHGIVGVGLEQVPILSKKPEISPVQLVELTPEQLSLLPEFAQPDITAMNLDTLVPPSPGAAGSGLPAIPPSPEPLKPWTLPESSSLDNSSQYNSQTQAIAPSFPNWPPAPPPTNSTPSNSTQTPSTPQVRPYRSPFDEILSQLPPPPPTQLPSNQLPSQQVYTVPTVPVSPPEIPPSGQVPTFNPNFPTNPEFNANFPPTAYLPTTPENNPPQPESQPSPLVPPDNRATNSPLPSGVTPGQQAGSSQALLDPQQRVNPNLATPIASQTTPTPATDPQTTEPTPADDPELVEGLDPDAWAYQQKLRQEFLARQAAANRSASNAQSPESSTPPQQQAFSQPNPDSSNSQLDTQQPVNPNLVIPGSEPTTPETNPQTTEPTPPDEPELVEGLKPEVWAYQQALREEFLARQAAANQGEPQPAAPSVPQQTATASDPQSVSETTATSDREVAPGSNSDELTHHQKQLLAYQQQLQAENRQQEQGGSLSEEEEAMLAGGEEFYTWFMELRQEVPNLTPKKAPSTIADRYPLAACPEKLSGRAVVGTVVNPNGEIIESPKVLRSTGSDILDDEALAYVEGSQFSGHDRPTAYQYSFEFNYDRESCAIAAPEGSSEDRTGNPEGETATQGDTSVPDIEAMEDSPDPTPTPSGQTDALQPGASPETASGQPQPSNPLTLEPQPEGDRGDRIYYPVDIPTGEPQ